MASPASTTSDDSDSDTYDYYCFDFDNYEYEVRVVPYSKETLNFPPIDEWEAPFGLAIQMAGLLTSTHETCMSFEDGDLKQSWLRNLEIIVRRATSSSTWVVSLDALIWLILEYCLSETYGRSKWLEWSSKSLHLQPAEVYTLPVTDWSALRAKLREAEAAEGFTADKYVKVIEDFAEAAFDPPPQAPANMKELVRPRFRFITMDENGGKNEYGQPSLWRIVRRPAKPPLFKETTT